MEDCLATKTLTASQHISIELAVLVVSIKLLQEEVIHDRHLITKEEESWKLSPRQLASNNLGSSVYVVTPLTKMKERRIIVNAARM